jgi:hypothetical protein
VHVADDPAARHLAHDVFHRGERQVRVRLVVHGEKNAGHDLDSQHQHRQSAEVVPEVEVLRRVIFGQMGFPGRDQRKALIDPGERAVERG